MSDLPDYRREIVIVESIELDVVGSATVDLTKVGGVAIATPTVTACVPVSIENDAIAYDGVNDRFKIDIKKWSATDTVDVEIQNATIAVTQSGTWNIGTVTTITNAVTVTGTVAVSGTVTVSGTVAISGTVAVTQSGTWNIATLTGITNNVNVDIVAQTMGNIDVNLAAQTADIDVNVTNASLTITGSVTVSSGAVTISTSGANNIVIDLLTQSAYTERRPTLSNNGASASWASETGIIRVGKFFPRGCRGQLDTIYVHCRDNAAAGGTITVYVSPKPSAAPLYSGTVTVPAEGSADWRTLEPHIIWEYDSMFIYIVCSVSDIQFAYDTGTPYDRHASLDSGVTWYTENMRMWIKVDVHGETVGDILGYVTVNKYPVRQSGVLAVDTAIKNLFGLVHWITCEAGAAASVFQLNDSYDNSGSDKWQCKVPANDTRHFVFDPPLPFLNGIYLDVDANVGSCTVGYT